MRPPMSNTWEMNHVPDVIRELPRPITVIQWLGPSRRLPWFKIHREEQISLRGRAFNFSLSAEMAKSFIKPLGSMPSEK